MSQDETDEEKEKRCTFLDTFRAGYIDCCWISSVVIQQWDFDACIDKCNEIEFLTDIRCCVNECSYTKLGIISVTRDETGNVTSVAVNPQGIVNSLMLSAGNDSQWEPVFSDSVTRCNLQFGGTEVGYDCDAIPLSLYEVISCSYVQNYMKCPNWNSDGNRDCQYTFEYVLKCVDNFKSTIDDLYYDDAGMTL